MLQYEQAILTALHQHIDANAGFVASLDEETRGYYNHLSSTYNDKRRMLVDQVKLLQAEDIDVQLVYQTNAIYHLKDSEATL